ncbi:MAG: hypothetical protein ACTSUD_05570 [Alphaproteobacteria bacterium]
MSGDLALLRRLLESYGADPARWPAERRDAALRCLEESAEARALRDQEVELDAALGQVAAPAPAPELMATILAAATAPRPRFRAASIWPFGLTWKPVTTLAAAAILGLVAGSQITGFTAAGEQTIEGEIGELAGIVAFGQEGEQ